ncbi:MAG: carboxymuconolactone decarboxylase family protein [Candidatus Dormibacteraeota bacterium]|uniref:Carboxymuconolactone decarboxylase family protein n=1 Tax=Candidatus Dormiibacter inghamiae TaxID=3127013 RepID=A0A934NG28_9BACT|nr:carboxymuconolactone decarboxylase family protein [Candidatus Dormibacteraeota bacterium]MBJ7606825.1 carboxymuconolactone decarboxylase family protein [Candidatus Dormibacteraeota bacterium]
MGRIPLATSDKGLLVHLAAWYSKRRFGKVVEPLGAMSHHRGVLATISIMEFGVQRWHRLDPTLQCLAQIGAASTIGCSWCMDFGYWEAHHRGVDLAKIEGVPRWRQSEIYTDLERLVLEYAEAMTTTPPIVTDGLAARLRDHLGDARMVELTELVAVENLRSRFNSALGLESQGFKAECPLPQRG